MIYFASITNGTIYPSVFFQMAQPTLCWGQFVPQDHFFFKSYISHAVQVRIKVIVSRNAQDPKLYVSLLVGGLAVIPLL